MSRTAPSARRLASSLRVTLALGISALPIAAQSPVEPAAFESIQTHAIEVRPDGRRLYVVNTPDSRLTVYDLRDPRVPRLWREIRTAAEPVAVASRTTDEVWVVCQLSDCVQVIDVDLGIVTATLRVGDEPMDVVFAGGKAFVSCSTDREVRVFDAVTRAPLGSVPVTCDEPGPMTVSADGSTVFLASRISGNDTTIVPEDQAPPQPAPTNPLLPAPPSVGLIVDSEDPAWSGTHGVVLPDRDVFAIDAASQSVVLTASDVGTILFDLCVDPQDGAVLVANTEARNLVRFEPNLRGHAIDSRVSRITNPGTPTVAHTDLNPGVDYATLPNATALANAVSQPTGLVFSPDGDELFVTSFGTDRLVVLNRAMAIQARIDIGTTRTGTASDSRSMRGPRSLVHHPSDSVIYLHNRLSNSISVVDTATRQELREIDAIHDPMPASHKEGRGFLYDARLSGNGTMSCASCHIDARFDNTSWDLGNPGGDLEQAGTLTAHPMKGPMITQSFQGLAGTAPFHWRGDRTDFQAFNPAFDSLMGGAQLPVADMDAYAAFIDTVVYPPNPNRDLNDSFVDPAALQGLNLFTSIPFNGLVTCVNCHSLAAGTNSIVFPGSILGEPQPFKTAQLRNLYKRTGRDPDPSTGESTAGFGILHDGSDESVRTFLERPVFGQLSQASRAADRARLEAFVNAFDTGTKPLVGFARTEDQSSYPASGTPSELVTALAFAGAGHGDVVVRGRLDGIDVGLLYRPTTNDFESSDPTLGAQTLADLETALRQGRATLTFLGAMPGEGVRVGLDRDQDGALDGVEAPRSFGAGTVGCGLELRANSDPFRGNDQFALVVEGAQPSSLGALLIGFAPANLPVVGIDLLVDPSSVISLSVQADAAGDLVGALPIPRNPGLVGLPLYGQAIFAGCGPFGISASNGVEFVVTD